jgi:hypothetical protein
MAGCLSVLAPSLMNVTGSPSCVGPQQRAVQEIYLFVRGEIVKEAKAKRSVR